MYHNISTGSRDWSMDIFGSFLTIPKNAVLQWQRHGRGSASSHQYFSASNGQIKLRFLVQYQSGRAPHSYMAKDVDAKRLRIGTIVVIYHRLLETTEWSVFGVLAIAKHHAVDRSKCLYKLEVVQNTQSAVQLPSALTHHEQLLAKDCLVPHYWLAYSRCSK